MLGVPAKSAWAMTYYWGRHPNKERLVFLFQGQVPAYKIQRIDKTTLRLTFPANIWTKENRPSPIDLSSTKIIKAIILIKNEFYIQTRTPAFGFVHFNLQAPAKLVIDFFKDKLGSQWKPGNKAPVQKKKAASRDKKKAVAPGQQQDRLLPKSRPQFQPAKGITHPQTLNSNPPAKQTNKETIFQVSRNGSKISGLIMSKQPFKGQGTPRAVPTAPYSSKTQTPAPQVKGQSTKQAKTNPVKGALQIPRSPNVIVGKISLVGPEKAQPLRPFPSPPAVPGAGLTRQQKAKANQSTGNLPQGTIVTAKINKNPPGSTKQATPEQAKPEHKKPKQATPEQTKPQDQQLAQQKTSPPQPTGVNATSQNATEPDFKAQVVQGETALANGQIESAKEIFELLAKEPGLPQKLRGTVLYALADSYFQLYQGNFKRHYIEITDTYEEAINFNPDSFEVPLALLRLFLVNLKVGNIPEAKGYFRLLLKKFPDYPQIPTAYYYWGEHYERQKNYEQAIKNYQHLIEKYPESPVTKNAAIGLARSLTRMEFYSQAWKIVQYISKRWPRAYIKEPDILQLSGLVALRNKKYKKAKEFYWLYFNLLPGDPKNDLTLARIGDIHLYLQEKKAAKKIYQKIIQMYPDHEGALIAKMRLAEEGIHDHPKVVEMFSVFDRPFNLRPLKIYSEIIEKQPQSPLAPLAQLKLAMWYLWEESLPKALKTAQEFQEKFPKSSLLAKAREVGAAALSKTIKLAVQENDFPKVISLWKKYKEFQKQIKDSETLLAVALSAWKTGRIPLALSLAKPYLLTKKFNKASYTALELVLNIQVSNQAWKEVLKITRELAKHKIPARLKAQLAFAQALAYENLGQKDKSTNLWQQLIGNPHLTKKQQGYAYYFLAKQAMDNQNLQTAYIFAQAALDDLWTQRQKQDKITLLDTLDILVASTEKSGRLLEALQWALKYEKIIGPDSPEWTSYRYKLAQLYRKAGDLEKWKEILKGLEKKFPEDHFAKLASADLQDLVLQKRVKNFLTN